MKKRIVMEEEKNLTKMSCKGIWFSDRDKRLSQTICFAATRLETLQESRTPQMIGDRAPSFDTEKNRADVLFCTEEAHEMFLSPKATYRQGNLRPRQLTTKASRQGLLDGLFDKL